MRLASGFNDGVKYEMVPHLKHLSWGLLLALLLVGGAHAQSFLGQPPAGYLLQGQGTGLDPLWASLSTIFDSAFCNTNTAFPVRTSGTWQCSTTASTNAALNGLLSIGPHTNPGHAILISGTIGGGVDDLAGIQNSVVFGAGNANDLAGVFVAPALAAGSAYTVTTLYGLRIENAFLHAGAAITNLYGLRIDTLSSGSMLNQAIWVQGTNPVGFGTNTAQAQLHVNANTVQNIAAISTDTIVELTAADGRGSVIQMNTYQNRNFKFGGLFAQTARGTAASPSALGSGDFIFSFAGEGYAAGFLGQANGGYVLIADEAFSNVAKGTKNCMQATRKGTTTNNNVLCADGYGHVGNTGLASTVTSCGTSTGAPTGNDYSGQVVTGTGAPTACTINFSGIYANPPRCVANLSNGTGVGQSASSTASVTFTFYAAAASQTLTWHCDGV